MRAFENLRWLEGLADDRRVGHTRELDQVEVAVVVQDHAGGTAAADRLDISLNVDQCRAGQIGTEGLAQAGQEIGVVERDRAEARVDLVRAVRDSGDEREALIDAPEGRPGLRRESADSFERVCKLRSG